MTKSMRRSLKLAVLAAASLIALTGAAEAQQAAGPVSPYYGNIHPFYGSISSWYGNIRPFYGNLRPFYGNIRPFWGGLSGFWGQMTPFTPTTSGPAAAFYGPTKSDPFWGSGPNNPYVHNPSPYVAYGQIGGFWTSEYANWQQVEALWANAQSPADFANVAKALQSLIIDPAASFWGKAAEQTAHSSSFGAAFSNAALAGMGVSFNSDGSINAASLENISPTDQAMFFLNFYDGLMNYSGTGHVDWWMGPTGWSPALAQQQVGPLGQPVSIGMLDFTVTDNQKNARGTVLQYGSSQFGDGHGAAVGSLIMSPSDGSNVMGVMPNGSAVITVYDPYDSTGTTNWTEIGVGVDTLAQGYLQKGDGGERSIDQAVKHMANWSYAKDAPDSLTVTLGGPAKIAPAGANLGVINASLGEPGWTLSPGWNGALASGSAKDSILVVAAGNDGVVQPSSIAWNFASNPTLLVVGSVGLDGTISNFSNTPGNACLIDTASGACDPLKNHFLVAPGELVLVSNGSGGFSRETGTSVAAPLVTGAIGLLDARWPWLADYPNETAEIILQSATRIHSPGYSGPGPDPVYGWGELNIGASQAPLNWRNLLWLQGPKDAPLSIGQVITQVQSGNQAAWNASKLYYTALERIGNTYRDFEIPLAASLVGQNVSTLAGQQMFQSYLNGSLRSWVAGGAMFASSRDYDAATAGFVASSQPMGQFGDAQLRVRLTPAAPVYGFTQHSAPVNMDFALVGQRQTIQFGLGDGAAALTGQPSLAGGADFQLGRGGANPLLGLASGGAYANWRMSFASRLTMSFGATDRYSVRDPQMLGAAEIAGGYGLPGEVYAANAENFGLDYAARRNLVLHASLTRLRENTGLLGVQSLQPGALGAGSVSQAASFGFDLGLSPTVMLSGSATLANTTAGTGQALTTTAGGLTSTAAEIALTKAGLFDARDRVRLTLSKPMQVVAGQLQFATLGVVDRQTGALGQIVETAGASNKTPFAAELFYGRVLDHDRAEASVFLRAGVNTDQFGAGPRNDYMVGYRYRLAF